MDAAFIPIPFWAWILCTYKRRKKWRRERFAIETSSKLSPEYSAIQPPIHAFYSWRTWAAQFFDSCELAEKVGEQQQLTPTAERSKKDAAGQTEKKDWEANFKTEKLSGWLLASCLSTSTHLPPMLLWIFSICRELLSSVVRIVGSST